MTSSTIDTTRAGRSGRRGSRRVPRRTLSTVVAVLLLVTVAMISSRLSDTSRQYEIVTGQLDRPTPFQSGSLVVSDVRVASRVKVRDDVLTTPGVFVVAQVAVRGEGRGTVMVQEAQLRSRDRTYLPYSNSFTLSVETGFESAQSVIFEVDPTDLAGLTLECSDRGIVYRYYTLVQTPLGITADNASAWEAAGRGAEIPVSTSESTQALS